MVPGALTAKAPAARAVAGKRSGEEDEVRKSGDLDHWGPDLG